MVLLEDYFELQEAENVSRFWKAIQIILYIGCAVFGLWCGYTIALLRLTFNNNCYLFEKSSSEESVELLDSYKDFERMGYIFQDTIRAPDSICNYCQYTMISSFIFSTIWLTFFIMCGKGGKSVSGLSQPWRIVLPATIFNFIYFIITFVAAIRIHQGTNFFCQRDIDSISSGGWCLAINDYDLPDKKAVSIRLQISVKTAWMAATSWFFAFMISLARIILVSDFNLYKINVYNVEDLKNSREELLKIINYDDKRIQFERKDSSKSTV